MAAFEQGLLARRTPCRPSGLPTVGRGIAEVHAGLLLIRPYREGNGRLARWLADLMAAQAGLAPPIYRFTGRGSRRERSRYLGAVKRGYNGHYGELADFFREALERGAVDGGSAG